MRHSQKWLRWLVGIVTLLGLCISPSGVFITASNARSVLSESESVFKPGAVLVLFDEQTARHTIDTLLHTIKAVQTGSIYGSDVVILKVAEGQELEISSYLSAQPGVLYAEPDYQSAIALAPNDPSFSSQWAHTKLRSTQAWDITTGSTAINIAILDTGIDATHPDLASKILPGHSFLTDQNGQKYEDANPVDLNGHGTHVAGIAAAITNNTTGVAGMSWGARIIPVRVLGENGSGWNSDITAGINWARTHGADIINLSLGGPDYSTTMQDAVTAAHNAEVLVVAAMGNDNSSSPFYPAAYDHVLPVAATNKNNVRSYFSNYGTHVDITAPGGEMSYLHDPGGIYSTMPTYAVYLTTVKGYYKNYDRLQGTSQAAPYISGLAALIWSVDATLSPDAVANIITSTALDLQPQGWDQYYGYGLADAKAALDRVNVPSTAPLLYTIANADKDGDYLVRLGTAPRATNYRLEVSANAGFEAATLAYSGPNLQHQVTGQPAGTWYYRIRASNVSGDSPWSTIVQTGVLLGAPVLMPIASGVEQDTYSLGWSAVAGAQGYRLQQAATEAFTQTVVRYLGDALQYDVTGQAGGAWFYRVQAFNAAESGAWSTIRSFTVPMSALAAPNLLTIENSDGDGNYVVQWTAVPSTTQYTLEESDTQYFETPVEVYTGPLSVYTVINHAGGTWYYRVRGHNAVHSSPWSAVRNAVVISWIFAPSIFRQYTAPFPPSTLSNGNFEAGVAGWVQYSLMQYPLIVDRTYQSMKDPHGGDWAVWMGGVLGEVAYIQQDVQIHDTAPYLTYWHWIESLETVCGADTMRVIVNASTVD
ncbi:MAG: hypothetical protein E4H27_03465, partial [Anaerolineales bacterium]